ncbi:MAG: TonB-dependent receptor [Bacteroidia bacterium]
MSQPEKSTVVFSNSKGEAWVIGIPMPLIRKVQMVGYMDRIDTIPQATNVQEIVLTNTPKSMGEVTITGNHMPGYQKDAVVPVQVLKTQDIEKRGAVTVKDLLAQELNIRVGYDPSLGSSMTMQGTGGEHIKILIDGVPVIGRQNGNIDLGQLNLSNVERVEVVKGPMSVLYGTDALGGVINIITKTPVKNQWNASMTGFYESTGQYNMDGTVNLGLKSTTISLNGGRNFFDGWDPEHTDSRAQLWNPREQYFSSVKVTQAIHNLKLSLLSSWFSEEVINKSNPLITPYFAYAYDQYYNTVRFHHQLSAEQKFKNRGILNFTGAYSTYEYIKNTHRKDMVLLSDELTADPNDDDTTKFRAVFSRATYVWTDPKTRWSVLGGVDFNFEEGQGKKIDNSTHSMTDVAAYASIDYKPIERITIRPAIRAIYNSQFNAPFVPSINALVKLTSNWNLRGSFSKGYRAPSLKEQYLYFVDNGIHNVRGNPNLQSETSNQFIFGAEYRNTGQDHLFILEPSVFYNDIHHKISLVQVDVSSTLYTYINLDRFTSRGTEIKARFVHKQYAINAGFSYTGTNGTFEGDIEQPAIAWTPEFNAGGDYTMKKSKTIFSVLWKYNGERPIYLVDNNDQIYRYTNQSYQMLDVSARQSMLKERISLTLGIRNILDVTNVRAMSSGGAHSGGGDGTAMVAMGRSFFTKLTFTFK